MASRIERIVLPATLHGDLTQLCICLIECVENTQAQAVTLSLVASAKTRHLPVLAFSSGLICLADHVKAVRTLVTAEPRVACAQPALNLDMSIIDDAIALAVQQALHADGGFVVADGLFLDTHGLDRTPRTAGKSLGQLQTAVAFSINSITFLREQQEHGGVSAHLSMHFEGRRVFPGTLGFDARSLLCEHARTELEEHGIVDLQGARYWHLCEQLMPCLPQRMPWSGGNDVNNLCACFRLTADDPENDNGRDVRCRLLPNLELVRLVLLSHHPPPADMVDDSEDAALLPRTAEDHRKFWGEQHGCWLPHERLSPFAVVVGSLGDRRVVPVACLWPLQRLGDVRCGEEMPIDSCM